MGNMKPKPKPKWKPDTHGSFKTNVVLRDHYVPSDKDDN